MGRRRNRGPEGRRGLDGQGWQSKRRRRSSWTEGGEPVWWSVEKIHHFLLLFLPSGVQPGKREAMAEVGMRCPNLDSVRYGQQKFVWPGFCIEVHISALC